MSTDTSNVQHLDEAGFEETVVNGDGVAVVDFWAEWCQPCKILGPTIDKLGERYKGKATVAKVDIDNAQSIAVKYGISSSPTVIIFKNGEPVDKTIGVVGEDAIAEKIDAQL